MSDRDSVAASTIDYGTWRLLRDLSVVGLVLEDRVPARDRLEAQIGDIAPFCFPPVDEESRAPTGKPGRAA